MISECVTKSSITADTAFRKDLDPCRGVQLFAHTCQPTLGMLGMGEAGARHWSKLVLRAFDGWTSTYLWASVLRSVLSCLVSGYQI